VDTILRNILHTVRLFALSFCSSTIPDSFEQKYTRTFARLTGIWQRTTPLFKSATFLFSSAKTPSHPISPSMMPQPVTRPHLLRDELNAGAVLTPLLPLPLPHPHPRPDVGDDAPLLLLCDLPRGPLPEEDVPHFLDVH
jgi:hypothetical protein